MSDATTTAAGTAATPEQAQSIFQQLDALKHSIDSIAKQTASVIGDQAQQLSTALAEQAPHGSSFFIHGLTVFVLAVFVGYYVVWRVTPALHSPLMAVTNAVSSVIIVGALIAAGPSTFNFSSFMGVLGVLLASINIFGGFIVTQRMLHMYKKKAK